MKICTEKISIPGKRSFICCCAIMGIIFIMSFVISVIDRTHQLINWPDGYGDIIGVALQVIITIVTMIISIIGISISLQNENVFRCKLTTLCALRKRIHYSFLQIIIISISLCIFNIAFYMLDLKAAVIGTSITSLFFLLQVIYLEVPTMVKTEYAVKSILKDNFIDSHLHNLEMSKSVKDAVRYLLYSDNLKNTFEFFKDDFDQEYNEYVLIKLLEFQKDLAGDLETQYNNRERLIIESSLLENVLDVLLRQITIPDNVYSKVIENKYLLICVLLQIHKLPEGQDRFTEKVGSLIILLFDSKNSSINFDLIADVIIILSAETIKTGDMSIITDLRRQLSNFQYSLRQASYALDVFALLSMYLYYLSCSDPDVPSQIKQTIKKWIGEGNIIEKGTKITSWKKMFSQVKSHFPVDYNRFLSLAMRNSDTLEYYLFGSGAKWVIFEPSYVAQWYLTNWLNTTPPNNYDFSALINQYPDLKNDLKYIGNKCFNGNRVFVATAEMNQIVEFYSDSKDHFLYFKIAEQVNHYFFNFINNLNYAELKSNADQAANLDKNDLAQKITNEIRMVLFSEWGFDPKQAVNDEKQYFYLLFEKTPEAINFEQCIINCCVDSVLVELQNATQKTIVYNDEQFDNNIQNILAKRPKYVTPVVKNTLPYIINSESLNNELIEVCDNCNEFQSRILGDMTIVLTDDAFRFNCEILKVELRALSDQELANKVEKFQRADGQFVFNGVFLPREEIIDIVRKKYNVLSIIIKYKVVSTNENVFEIVPYSNT